MKNRAIFSLLYLLFVMGFLTGVQAQVKEITADEYRKAVEGANKKTSETYPRISTSASNIVGLGPSSFRTVYETERRSYNESQRPDSDDPVVKISIDYDGEHFDELSPGLWMGFGNRATCGFSPQESPAVAIFYTLEETTEAGSKFRIYIESKTLADTTNYYSKTKIDSVGRIVSTESNKNYLYTSTYEYPKTVTPIQKPTNFGSALDLTKLH